MMVALGKFFFRFRGGVSPTLMVLLLIISTPRDFLGDPSLDSWLDAAGALVVILGLAVRAITIGYEYIVRGGRKRQVYANRLVQGGVYAHTRNPMYLGNGLITLGLAMVVNAWQFYLIGLPFIALMYASIIAAEEAFLREKFGAEFDAYCARVNRILPRLSGFKDSIEGMRFNWRRVLVKDYGTIYLSIVSVICLDWWHDYAVRGPSALITTGHAWLAAFLIGWFVLFLAVRWLKKTRRLEGDRPDQPHPA